MVRSNKKSILNETGGLELTEFTLTEVSSDRLSIYKTIPTDPEKWWELSPRNGEYEYCMAIRPSVIIGKVFCCFYSEDTSNRIADVPFSSDDFIGISMFNQSVESIEHLIIMIEREYGVRLHVTKEFVAEYETWKRKEIF